MEELKTRLGAQVRSACVALRNRHCVCAIGTSDEMRQMQKGKSQIEANKQYLYRQG
jgi:hypothetical protein